MSDELTGPVSDSSSAPAGSESSSTEQSTADITAQVLSEASGETPAAPPPADPSSTLPTPAAATRGDEDDAEYQSLLASGAVPTDRHKAAITNTRNKTRAEVEREYRERYGWADQIDRQQAEGALSLMNALGGPQGEVALRIIAQQMGLDLVKPGQPAQAEPQGPPPPDVKLDDGSEFFSAAAYAKREAWLMSQFDQRLQQATARYEPLVQRQIQTEMRQHADAEATSVLGECRKTWPSFTALESDILARMQESDRQAKLHRNPALSLTLDRAYIQAFAAKGLPALQAAHDTDRASQLSRKAAASAAPPSAARGAVTPLRDRDRSTEDITREVLNGALR